MKIQRAERNDPQERPRLIIIQGPTGVGKSALALDLARKWGGEIISADSMQVYRHLDIGTAKPTGQDRALVPHHLLDLVNPDEPFNAAMFIEEADRVITELHSKGIPIFVVGGTGLYIKGLLGGLFPYGSPSERLRKVYLEDLTLYGKGHLYRKLQERDPQAASCLNENDTVRIIRALEVFETTGRSITTSQKEHGFANRRYLYLKIGINVQREELYARIEKRIDLMMAAGLIREVEEVLARGYKEGLKPLQSLNYKHIVNYLNGNCSKEDAVRLTKRDSRRYAKRQLTWFKKDPEIIWFTPAEKVEMEEKIKNFIGQQKFP